MGESCTFREPEVHAHGWTEGHVPASMCNKRKLLLAIVAGWSNVECARIRPAGGTRAHGTTGVSWFAGPFLSGRSK